MPVRAILWEDGWEGGRRRAFRGRRREELAVRKGMEAGMKRGHVLIRSLQLAPRSPARTVPAEVWIHHFLDCSFLDHQLTQYTEPRGDGAGRSERGRGRGRGGRGDGTRGGRPVRDDRHSHTGIG
jgi:hypothetical protein